MPIPVRPRQPVYCRHCADATLAVAVCIFTPPGAFSPPPASFRHAAASAARHFVIILHAACHDH